MILASLGTRLGGGGGGGGGWYLILLSKLSRWIQLIIFWTAKKYI